MRHRCPAGEMNRFFVEPEAVNGAVIEITDKEDLNHMAKVLRLKPGDFIEVSDSKEYEYVAELVEVGKSLAVAKIHDKQTFTKEPDLKVTLFQGVPKQGKMETIIQKTVELGISEIVPVFTERTVVSKKDGWSKKQERWQKIAAEAVKQCKRGLIPLVREAVDFSEMAASLPQFDLALFLYENEKGTTIKDVLTEVQNRWQKEENDQKADCQRRVAIIVGPEGGFSDQEANALKDTEAFCVTLGKTILRTETAGMAALAMIMYQCEL